MCGIVVVKSETCVGDENGVGSIRPPTQKVLLTVWSTLSKTAVSERDGSSLITEGVYVRQGVETFQNTPITKSGAIREENVIYTRTAVLLCIIVPTEPYTIYLIIHNQKLSRYYSEIIDDACQMSTAQKSTFRTRGSASSIGKAADKTQTRSFINPFGNAASFFGQTIYNSWVVFPQIRAAALMADLNEDAFPGLFSLFSILFFWSRKPRTPIKDVYKSVIFRKFEYEAVEDEAALPLEACHHSLAHQLHKSLSQDYSQVMAERKRRIRFFVRWWQRV